MSASLLVDETNQVKGESPARRLLKPTRRDRLEPFIENMSEATVACLITMVQGNVLALGFSHWLIASQTGFVAGSITALAILFSGIRRRWIVAALLGLVTAVVDFFVHPGMFGHIAAEAAVTGIGAALLSLLLGGIWDRFQDKP